MKGKLLPEKENYHYHKINPHHQEGFAMEIVDLENMSNCSECFYKWWLLFIILHSPLMKGIQSGWSCWLEDSQIFEENCVENWKRIEMLLKVYFLIQLQKYSFVAISCISRKRLIYGVLRKFAYVVRFTKNLV